VFRATTCESCGAKFRAHRDRCPRCRAVIVAPDPVAAAASSRRMMRTTAGFVGVFLVALGILWMRSDAGDSTPATGNPSAAAAGTQLPTSPAAAPSGPQPAIPFLDPSGSASLAYQAGDYQTALAQFEEAVRKNPTDAESLSNLGQVLVKLGRPVEAIPHLQRATSLNPDRWAYRFNLARALGLLGQWDESIASYRQAQRLFPDDYVTTFNLAMALHKGGHESAAVDQYRRAIELNPDDAAFRMALGISYERLQRPADAVSAYSEYLRLSPAGAEAERVRARIAHLSGTAASGPAAGTNRGSSDE
jgi:tetratricopeptide (TPR) repeat protein